ncbi:MAG: hypothetical protein IPN53_05325 [Comamonadaceae bacterium]|nr:hypothetical protein [Comamonadaceae bacterium]
MFDLSVALLVTTVVAFAFTSTRRIGVISITLLAFLFPKLAAGLLCIGAVAAILYYLTKEKSL